MSSDAPPRRTTNSSRGSAAARWDASERAPRTRLILWAAAYVIVTTFSFAPPLTFRGAPARAGSIASRDVVAPRDLIVPDPAATARQRAEAAAEGVPGYAWGSAARERLERESRES